MIDASRSHAALASLALCLALSACASFEGRARYRAAERAVETAEAEAATPADDAAPFPGAATLDRDALVEAVLRRNPTIAAARHAWRAALAQYPQEIALEDPMVGYMAGPRSFDSPQIRRAQRIEARQAFPFPGKLALRGAAALAEAEAAAQDHAGVRVQLAAMASSLYDEYWLAARAVEINDEHLALVRELSSLALSRYESGTAEQQDPLRTELEEAELLHREVELGSALRVTAQQIALLLHHGDGAAIPPPPDALVAVDADEAPDPAASVAERPELRAAEARIEGREAAERLVRREFLPDFALTGGYDTFWEIADQRPFVGIEMNLPLAIGKRRAALAQAQAEVAQARSERDATRDALETELRTARERLAEARHGHAILRDRVLPAARDQLAAARIGFESGRVALGDVIEAERALRDAELGEETAQARQSQRAAELLAAQGRIPGGAAAATTHEGVGHE